MLLAVAGLDSEAIGERTRQLATGDWSRFSSADRYAFAFARKLSTEPWNLNDADLQGLIDHYGLERALDVVWWSCRCHYMTRVADAFQIPLERDNVFEDLASSPGIGPAPKN